jgi:hypothetical protein
VLYHAPTPSPTARPTVEAAVRERLVSLLAREGTAATQEVDECDGNAAVDVEDEVLFLRCSQALDGDRVLRIEAGVGQGLSRGGRGGL